VKCLAITLAFASFACRAGPEYPDAPTAVVDVPNATESMDPERGAIDGGTDGSLPVGLSPPFDQLGRKCAADERDRPSTLVCDPSGVVSGVYAELGPPNETLPLPDARTIAKRAAHGPPPGRSLEVGIAEPLIAVRFAFCPDCTGANGFLFVGDLRRLTDAELSSLQQRIGLPPATLPLRTEDDWRGALASDAG
jgi:hypothetical protein